MATSLDELSAIIAMLADRTGHGVVRVGRSRCGVVIAAGRVLTVARVARPERVTVTFATGATAIGLLTPGEPVAALASIVMATSGAEPLDRAAIPAGVGQPVFAVTPSGSATSVTFGSVVVVTEAFVGPRGRVAGTIEHTAPLPRGAAGSALVDAEGRLVAINVDRLGDGLYLAMPADAWLSEPG